MRTSSRLTLLGSALLAGASFLPLSALAQSDTTETVLVTAEKRSEEAKNVPMSISVIGADELNKLNIRSFEDILSQVPGLSITEADPTHPVLILRGINAGGDGSTVATYLDEMPYGSSNALANGVDTAPNLDTYDMKHVEVLRGPQGTLYGASAEGGLIKFVTNAPDPSGFDDSFEIGGTQLDHSSSGLEGRGMVNVPLTNNLAVRIVGFDSFTPGFISDPGRNISNINDLRSFGGRVSVLYQPTDKLTIRLSANAQQVDSGNVNAEDIALVGGTFHPLYGSYKQQRTTNEPDGVRYFLYNATVNWDLNFATITSSSSFGALHDYALTDATGVYGADVQGFLHQEKFTQEVRLASDPGWSSLPIDWLVGAYYTNETSYLHQDIVTSFHGPLLAPGTFVQGDSEYNEIAGFVNATYHILQTLDLGVGGRYSTNDQIANEFGLATATPHLTSDDRFTWSVSLDYHFDAQTTLYGRVATGFRPGGPNDVPPAAPPSVPVHYGPDSLTEYELGAKGDLPDEHLSFDADVYLINWKDIQLLTFVNGFNVNGNGGTATSKGAEANVTWTPIDRLVLNLNGAFTDAYLTENTEPLFVGGLSGNALPWSPKWSATLNGDYTFEAIGDWTPYIGATWHYVGTRYSDYYGQLYQAVYSLSQNYYAMPSYNTFDARIGATFDRWSVEIYGKNINSAKGVTAFGAYGTSAASGGAGTVGLIQPRLIGIVLRGKL